MDNDNKKPEESAEPKALNIPITDYNEGESADKPEETPEETPVEAPEDKPKETPADAPAEEPVEVTAEPVETPEHSEIADVLIGNDASEEKPEETPAKPEAPAEESKPETPFEEPKEELKEEPKEEPKEEAPIEETPAEPITVENTPFGPVEPVVAAPLSTEPEKKKHGGLIALIVLLVVLLLGAGAAFAYYVFAHTPENLAISSISNLMNASGLSVSGFAETVSETSTDKTRLDIDELIDHSGQSETNLRLEITSGGKKTEASASAIIASDYITYLKVNGVKKLLGLDSTDLTSQTITDFVSEAEGNWWRVNAPEIIDSVSELDATTKSGYKEKYTCVTSALDSFKQKKSAYVKLYKKNQFISFVPYSTDRAFNTVGKSYLLSFDANKLAAFLESVPETFTEVKTLASCLEVSETSASTSVSVSELQSSLAELPDVIVTVKEDFFGGDITGLYLADENYRAEFSVSKTATSVSVPTDSKNITTLVSDAVSAFESYYLSLYSSAMSGCNSSNGEMTDCLTALEDYDLIYNY